MCCQIDVLSMCVIVVILVCQTGTELSAGGRDCETFIQVGLCGCRNSHLCPFPIVSTNDPWNDEEKPRSSPDDATTRSVRMMALATAIPSDMTAAIAANPTYPDLFNAAFGTPDIFWHWSSGTSQDPVIHNLQCEIKCCSNYSCACCKPIWSSGRPS